MSSTTVRETALDALAVAQPVAPLDAPEPGQSLASGYGRDVFNARVMRQRLPRDVYDRLMQTMTRRAPLDPADADVIAGAMKDWALEHGATHDRADRRKARRLPFPHAGRSGLRRVFRKNAHQG